MERYDGESDVRGHGEALKREEKALKGNEEVFMSNVKK